METARVVAVASAVVMLAVSTAAPARADHPLVVEGREAVERAQFQQALEAFDRAAQGDGLERTDVLALLEGRALAYAATDDNDRLDEALTALASLDPEHQLPPELPPHVRDRFEQAAQGIEGALEVDANVSQAEGWIEANPVVAHDPAGLVRELRVYVRKGEQPWEASTDHRFMLTPQEPVELYVEAAGIGGAVLARDGSRERPLRFEVTGALEPVRTGAEKDPDPHRSSSSSKLWLWGGGTAALLLAGGVVTGLVLGLRSGQSQRTQPSFPTVTDF